MYSRGGSYTVITKAHYYFCRFLKEIDIAATGLSLTESRSRVIDFSFQFDMDFKSLLIPYPQKNDALGNITLPFRYYVYIV